MANTKKDVVRITLDLARDIWKEFDKRVNNGSLPSKVDALRQALKILFFLQDKKEKSERFFFGMDEKNLKEIEFFI